MDQPGQDALRDDLLTHKPYLLCKRRLCVPCGTAFSNGRLARYVGAMNSNLANAVRLYEWNVAVSGAFYEALGTLEVVLRNALSERLAAQYGTLAGQWYDDRLGFHSVQAADDIAVARYRVAKLRRGEAPGRVIAELNFGFWSFLLAKRYEASLGTG